MIKKYLTTIDNPYDPQDEFQEWYEFDMQNGYYTCNRFDRLSKFEDDMSENERIIENNRIVDRLFSLDFIKIYKIIEKEAKIYD